MGTLLVPPLGQAHGLGPLVPTAVSVQGQNWRSSSMDIAVAGGEGWPLAVNHKTLQPCKPKNRPGPELALQLHGHRGRRWGTPGLLLLHVHMYVYNATSIS